MVYRRTVHFSRMIVVMFILRHDMFHSGPGHPYATNRGRRAVELFSQHVEDSPQKEHLVYIRAISRNLQSVWDAPNQWTAVWRWVFLQMLAAKMAGLEPDPTEPPLWSPFEVSMLYFHGNWHRAVHCGNPSCAAPYFFATKKGQKYCTDLCAEYGQREAKKRWWTEHGDQWRTNRRAKTRPTSRRS